ncbi:MAG TPA: extracellular solute-binding protein [Chloroflexota bacterium]|nr:extracellular solute-binding protein [Chloroflexota bacterium]
MRQLGAHRRRAALRGVAGGATGLALAACGAPAADPAGRQRPVRQPITLTFTHWDDIRLRPTTYLVWYTWVFGAFAEKHPGATAEFQHTTGNYLEKFVVAAAGGTPIADLAALNIGDGRALYDKGALTEVDAFIKQVPGLAPARYLDAATAYSQVRGRRISLPAWANSSVLWVNSRMLRKAGLDAQGADLKTWDDLVRYGQALTQKDAAGRTTQLGFPFAPPGLEEWGTWAYANGAELQDAEVTKVTLNTPAVAEMVRFRRDAYNRFAQNWAEDLKGDLFQTERQAILHRNFGARSLLLGGAYVPADFEFWMLGTPQGPGGRGPGASIWVNQMGIPTGVRDPEMSFELGRTALDLEGQSKMHQMALLEPSLKDYYQTPQFAQLSRDTPLLKVGVDLFARGKRYPFFRRFADVSAEILPILQDGIVGKLDVQQSLQEAERRANAVLAG